ncbi:phage tail protein [Lacrimispora sp. NSJ-141]|uniref:Phage tail protein n=1 Tax=Lientehia hominis TaxID=2897778 RepID=A0AAP2W8N8_9FIRM|nr:phage tail spike protein [Lientehia hominis]MCD2493753.1 phage tail protein [Lientehia hominis]
MYDGRDALNFEMSSENEMYPRIAEEIRIEDEKNRYIVKNVDEHNGIATVDCEIDLDDWREKFWREFRTTDSLLSEVIEQIKPQGWSVSGVTAFTRRDTVEASEGMPLENVVSLDILSKACEVYGAVVNYDTLNKVLKVINPEEYTDSGEYFTDELNLRSIGFVGNSTDFATRLYAYGKKDDNGVPLTFAAINNGKEYIDDNGYSNRIISIGWSDERYTVPKSLLEAAKKKLKELAYPVRSYECDIRNMSGNIQMYQGVTLIDRRRKIRIKHRVVEYKEYPKRHDLDVVTISAAVPRIESEIKSISNRIDEVIRPDGSVIAERISGFINGALTSLKAQYNVAEKQDVVAILFENLDENSPLYGALAIGTQGLMISKVRIADGDWDWSTALTANGLIADIIVTGLLADRSGRNFWNLDTGEFITTKGKIGGWDIGERAIYKDITMPSGIIYRVYIQPPLITTEDKTWVISCQRSTDGGKEFFGTFILYSDGTIHQGKDSDGLSIYGDLLEAVFNRYGVSVYDKNGKQRMVLNQENLIFTGANNDILAGMYMGSSGKTQIVSDNIYARNAYSGSITVPNNSGGVYTITISGGIITKIS